MRLLNVDTIDEARGKLLENAAGKIPGVEYIDFSKGRNRVLAEDITAAENVPGFNKSTVDGYAVSVSGCCGGSVHGGSCRKNHISRTGMLCSDRRYAAGRCRFGGYDRAYREI